MNYTEAVKKLDTPIKKDSKKVGNNTYLIRHDDYIGVRLHETEVVKIYPNKYILESGGWYTPTTKERINRFCPVRLWQEKGRWFVGDTLYYDGMALDTQGEPLKPLQDDKILKSDRKIKGKIARYVKLAKETLEAGMPTPSGGDCWFCALRETGGKTLGDTTSNHEHLLSHMEEGYIVPSLLANAVIEAGYPCPGIILGVSEDNKRMGERYASIDSVGNSLRKYLNKRILPAGLSGR